jgi:hypothetical protein
LTRASAGGGDGPLTALADQYWRGAEWYRLYQASGDAVDDYRNDNEQYTLAAGAYELVFAGDGWQVGGYSFRLS